MSKRVQSPREQVTGVLPEPQRMEATVEALLAAGFPESDINVYGGEEALAEVDPDGRGHGLLGRLTRSLEHFGQEGEEYHAAADELRAGHLLIAVSVKDEGQKDGAVAALRGQGVDHLRYWGRWQIESFD
jgi:hypothetical protein